MEDLIRRVNDNKTGIFKRIPELIVVLDRAIFDAIGDDSIHVSEFIIAKIKGRIRGNIGHPEITDEIFIRITDSLACPDKIFQDIRSERKFIFISPDPIHQVVVEVFRKESGKTEINTIHLINTLKLKQLERKFPVVYSSGGSP